MRVISALANPLLIKQLREEMRSRKIFFIVPVYIALLSIVPLIAVSSNSGTSFNPMSLAANSKITDVFVCDCDQHFAWSGFNCVWRIQLYHGTRKGDLRTFGINTTVLHRTRAGKFSHGFLLILLILLASLPVLSTLFFMGGLA